MQKVPSITFHMRERMLNLSAVGNPNPFEWVRKNTEQLFAGKRVLVFGLPGAFTPTCSNSQLPGYENMHDQFINDCDIDEIWCTSVNDAFVMYQWAQHQNINKVKMLPDGNGEFATAMGMLVDKSNLGFGLRSWRYACVIDDLKVVRMFDERDLMDKCPDDPYYYSAPEYVYDAIKMGQPISSAG